MKPLYQAGLALGVLFLAGVAGYAFHARQFSHAQIVWMDSVKVAHTQLAQARDFAIRKQAEADSLRALAHSAAGTAARLEASQRQNALASRQAHEALTAARSTGDSLRAALVVVTAVESERDTALAAGAAWHRAYVAESQAAQALSARGDSLAGVVTRQDSLLQTGLRVVGRSGCRIPLLGVACPEVVVGYGYTAEYNTGAVALHRGVAVTAGWRVF